MNDTDLTAGVRFRELIMARTGEQRLLMGCSMFDAAKQIVKDSIRNQDPGISEDEMRKQIFLRFYGLELSKSEIDKVLEVIT